MLRPRRPPPEPRRKLGNQPPMLQPPVEEIPASVKPAATIPDVPQTEPILVVSVKQEVARLEEFIIQVDKDLTQRLAKQPLETGAKAEKEAFDFVVQHIADFKKIVPREKIQRPINERTCNVFLGNTKAFSYQHTMSWCVPNPTTGTCDISLCFDVREVRAWMVEQKCGLPSDDPSKPRPPCKMFQYEQIKSVLSKYPDISVPEHMTDEFRFVLEEFEMLPQDPEKVVNKDIISKTVFDSLRKYIERKKEQAETLGVFWRYTYKALAKVTSWTLWLLENPYFIMIGVTIVKLIRITLCLVTTVGWSAAFGMLGDIIKKTFGDVKNMGKGIPKLIITYSLMVLECLTKGTSVGNVIADIGICVLGALSHPSVELAILNVARQMIAGVVSEVLQGMGLGAISHFSHILITQPELIVGVFSMDADAARQYDIMQVVSRYSVQNWDFLAVLLFFRFVPLSLLRRLLNSVLSLICPPCGATLALLPDNVHPIVFIKRCIIWGGAYTYIMQVIDEVRSWMFDLMPCLARYLIGIVKQFLRLEAAPDPAVRVTCCMAGIVQELQDQYYGGGAQQLQDAVRGPVQGLKNLYSRFVSTGEGRDELQQGIDDLATQVPIDEPVDPTVYPKIDLISSSNASVPALEVPAEYVTTLEQPNSFLSRLWDSLGPSRLWVTPSDARDKVKVVEEPFFTLTVDGGKKVNFYLFVWKRDFPFQDKRKTHVSVMAQEIHAQFPDAVAIYRGHMFVVLQRLPPVVARHILLFQNPVIDLNQYTS